MAVVYRQRQQQWSVRPKRKWYANSEWIGGQPGYGQATNTVAKFTGTLTNEGAYVSNGSDNYFTSLSVSSSGYLQAAAGDRFFVSGNLISSSTQSTAWSTNSCRIAL